MIKTIRVLLKKNICILEWQLGNESFFFATTSPQQVQLNGTHITIKIINLSFIPFRDNLFTFRYFTFTTRGSVILQHAVSQSMDIVRDLRRILAETSHGKQYVTGNAEL